MDDKQLNSLLQSIPECKSNDHDKELFVKAVINKLPEKNSSTSFLLTSLILICFALIGLLFPLMFYPEVFEIRWDIFMDELLSGNVELVIVIGVVGMSLGAVYWNRFGGRLA